MTVIDWVLVLIVALAVLATIEWLRWPFIKVDKVTGERTSSVPAWVWWVMAPILAVAYAVLFELLMGKWLIIAVMSFSLATLAKDNIISLAKSKVDQIKGITNT